MPSIRAYKAGAFVSRNAPRVVTRSGARAAALAATAVSSDRRLLVRRNLERALARKLSDGEARRRVASVFDWYARYYVESFELPDLDAEEIDAGFGYEGIGALEEASRSGAGPILVLPHLGTWEWAAWWLALVPKLPVTAVVEPLEPPEVFDWFVSFREKLGMNIVSLGPEAGTEVTAAIKRGDVICLLSDRDIGGAGIPVDFFGERTRLPAGPAMLALRTGAPLIPSAVYWKGSTRHAIATPPLDTSRQGKFREDLSRVVQDYAHALEELIRVDPEQWHLMSPNWPSDYVALGQPVPDHLQDL